MHSQHSASKQAAKKVVNCTCNMPLCICEPEPEPEPEKEEKKDVAVAKPKPKAPAGAKKAPATTTFGGFGGFGGLKTKTEWNLKGDLNEQCREAIKEKDDEGVLLLLKAGANASYQDRTGNYLIHLAAMFDRLSTVKILVEAGANVWVKNPSGETSVDLAPPSLARKMKELQPKA